MRKTTERRVFNCGTCPCFKWMLFQEGETGMCGLRQNPLEKLTHDPTGSMPDGCPLIDGDVLLRVAREH